MNNYVIYVVDTETSSLSPYTGDIIELSLYRLSDDIQKTWLLKATNESGIESGALRVNGHKLEDILHKTKYGQENYLDPGKAIIEIENWIDEDNIAASNRVLAAHNVSFDKSFLEQLWEKCGSKDTYPFGRRCLDTMQIEFFLDMCKGNFDEGYSLHNLIKKYGLKNDKAHSAASDTLACKQVLDKQVEFFKKVLNNVNV